MRKVILIPDSFKGTMSAVEFCAIVKDVILTHYPKIEVVSIPVADGGEGSVDSFLAAVGGEKKYLTVKGPYMEDVESFYGLIDGGSTAVIEMAACSGLPLVGDNLNPEKTTTYGVGQLIVNAARSGCKKIILGLGGSATNDFGAGAVAAAGIRFFDNKGDEFIPVGATLSKISRIDTSGLISELKGIEIITMCDIDNPLYGPTGAAYVFGPQKGASTDMINFLDNQLKAVAETVKRELGKDVADIPGAGAAGGMGGGMVTFLDSKLTPGIEIVLDTVGFDVLLNGTGMVISGEGKIDAQSLRGKVVIGVARRTKKHGVPLVAIVGDIGDNIEKIYDEGVSAIFSINRIAVPLCEAKSRNRNDLKLTMDNLIKFINCINNTFMKHND
jgi:glycerate kinase